MAIASTATMPNQPLSAPSGKREPEIVTIPQQYYGVALTLKNLTAAEMALQQNPPAPVAAPVLKKPLVVGPTCDIPPIKHSAWPIVLGVVLVFLAIGGGFIYFSRDFLFKKPAPPAPAPVVVEPPAAPVNATAAVSGSAVALNWVNGGSDADGYRIERKEAGGTFIPLTNLPSGSTAFLDVSAQTGQSYAYQVVALGVGGESSPAVTGDVSIPTQEPPKPAAPTLPPGGLDSDSDGLSDLEEGIYGTDVRNPDSDSDGYLDGNEVYHLYNPLAKAPGRLLDSGKLTLVSSTSGWSLISPLAWKIVWDREDGARATIDTAHGETFVLTIESNPLKSTVLDWYLAKHPGILSTSIRSFTTKGGMEGILSEDRMQALFPWGDKIFVVRYDMDGQTFINYRTTFEMMLNALKLVGAPTVSIPTDEELGGPGALIGAPSSTIPEAVPPVVSAEVASSTPAVITSNEPTMPNEGTTTTTP
ncbi:MAG: fibronectin type III domain-containing protein [bacterium]|nr:fibronectin type III domain-containing protein [bacterium]